MAPAYKEVGSDCYIFFNKKSNKFPTITRMLKTIECYTL